MVDCDFRVIIGSVVAFIAALLILVLVPLHFSYIERQHVGFKKNTITNEVDKGTVYYSGTHAWGVGKTAVAFPSTFERIEFRGDNALSFFTDAGQITVEVVFYFRVDPARLSKLYSDFGLAYFSRVVSIAQAELRNAATQFTTLDYQNNRPGIADGLYAALAATLPQTGSVAVNRSYFFLERINLPSSVLTKRVQVFTNTQLQITQDYNRTATQTRLNTQLNETRISNQAFTILQNASVVAARMVTNAKAAAFAKVQKESGSQLVRMISILQIHTANVTDHLLKFNALLDAPNNLTLLSGISNAVLQHP